MSRPIWSLRILGTGDTVASRVTIADGFLSRLRGLQFRRPLGPGEGLLLVPCSSIHTMFVRGPIDAVFLDRSGAVLGVEHHISPWRPLVKAPRKTYATLELPAGGGRVHKGDRLQLDGRPPNGVSPPKSVRFITGRSLAAVPTI
ncbi:MAG: DUF192 domain-containing protein [Phycisphaerales bacterium]|nr:MAG: DUF192 domain-containing protein [Phycisphaerales bacterium]